MTGMNENLTKFIDLYMKQKMSVGKMFFESTDVHKFSRANNEYGNIIILHFVLRKE